MPEQPRRTAPEPPRALIAFCACGDVNIQRIINEMEALAETAGFQICGHHLQRRDSLDRSWVFGEGSLQELSDEVRRTAAEFVLIANNLSPTQLLNVEEKLNISVLDRTQLILRIFALHAHTAEGKLQVELAELEYQLPRLKGWGTELSRLGGGIGTRGPGETKLEADRRRIRDRIAAMRREIEEVRRHRAVQRKARRKLNCYAASLVGYTSAGKSTLLNALTHAGVLESPQLFATLDPTTRAWELEDGATILLTDTVGFITDLPHGLVAAFRATLEEVALADFLIHVVDASSEHIESEMQAVQDVLKEIKAEKKPQLIVFNKVDLVADTSHLRNIGAHHGRFVLISALTGFGLDALESECSRLLSELMVPLELELPLDRQDIVALCYKGGRDIQVEYTEDAILITGEVPPEISGKIMQLLGHPSSSIPS
jgi:GTP-binding protein HflX